MHDPEEFSSKFFILLQLTCDHMYNILLFLAISYTFYNCILCNNLTFKNPVAYQSVVIFHFVHIFRNLKHSLPI